MSVRSAPIGATVVAWLTLVAGCNRAGQPQVLFTADTEGATKTCDSCAGSRGPGGLSRRATVLTRLRTENPGVLVVDAGNALIGADSIASRGRVIVAAYNALSYDVVNLSYGDFRFGLSLTLDVLRDARFSLVSATLLDATTGRPLVAPYVVKNSGGLKVAFVGVTELPPGVEAVPHLLRQLAGITVRPAARALSEWLPRAQSEADHVVLLYAGSAAGLGAVHREFGSRLAAILVAGLQSADVPKETRPPIAATGRHGAQVGSVRWDAGGGVDIHQVDVDVALPHSEEIERVVKAYGGGA